MRCFTEFARKSFLFIFCVSNRKKHYTSKLLLVLFTVNQHSILKLFGYDEASFSILLTLKNIHLHLAA